MEDKTAMILLLLLLLLLLLSTRRKPPKNPRQDKDKDKERETFHGNNRQIKTIESELQKRSIKV
jgi:hypothetical protein